MTAFCRCSISLALTLVAISISGCLEITSNTEVRRDGSVRRTYTFTGDSSEVMTSDYPLPIDSSWTTTLRETEKGKFERVVNKSFVDAGDLNAALMDTTRRFPHVRVALEKRFRWFFTEHAYSETYLNNNPFQSIPLSEYVPQVAIDQFRRHELNNEPFLSKGDSLALVDAGQRFEEWRARTVFESFYSVLATGVRLMQDPSLTPASLDTQKETLFLRTRQAITEPKGVDTVIIIVQSVLKTPRVRDALSANAPALQEHYAKLEYQWTLLTHPYSASITMPGIIVETNASSIEGNTATWKEVMTFACFVDHDLSIVSRTVNWSMIALAGALVVLALGVSVGAFIRRRARVAAGA